MITVFFFYAISALMIGAAISVVASRRPLYSVLSLLVAMFCLAALFVMLEAYVAAVLQILLYAGAVLVLFLFVIMLLNLEPEPRVRFRIFARRTIGMAAGALLLGYLARAFGSAGGGPGSMRRPGQGLVLVTPSVAPPGR
jgi:NADH-quinone oxidoreductase subunit J